MNTHASHKTVGTLRLYLEVVRGRGRALDACNAKTTQSSGQSPLNFPPFVFCVLTFLRNVRSPVEGVAPYHCVKVCSSGK